MPVDLIANVRPETGAPVMPEGGKFPVGVADGVEGVCAVAEDVLVAPKRGVAVFVGVAVDFYHAYPNMGAMVLECTGMPPFARALQHEIDIPIFSWGTLLDYAYSVVVHRDYYGHV